MGSEFQISANFAMDGVRAKFGLGWTIFWLSALCPDIYSPSETWW